MMQFIKRLIDCALRHEFIRYFIVGGLATVVDWSSFFVFNQLADVHYQLSLIVAWSLGTLVHYMLSRFFAFRSQARQVGLQLAAHVVVSVISLGLSTLAMYLLIEVLKTQPMAGRILTTAAIFIINYLMHKNFTFNRRLIK